MGLLDGKSAVVTGVGPGIGRAVSLALAEQGASVALGARTESALKEVANEIEATGGRAVFSPTNIADAEQCATLAKTAVDAFGKIDIVVQNAFMHGPFAGAVDTDPEDWRQGLQGERPGDAADDPGVPAAHDVRRVDRRDELDGVPHSRRRSRARTRRRRPRCTRWYARSLRSSAPGTSA